MSTLKRAILVAASFRNEPYFCVQFFMHNILFVPFLVSYRYMGHILHRPFFDRFMTIFRACFWAFILVLTKKKKRIQKCSTKSQIGMSRNTRSLIEFFDLFHFHKERHSGKAILVMVVECSEKFLLLGLFSFSFLNYKSVIILWNKRVAWVITSQQCLIIAKWHVIKNSHVRKCHFPRTNMDWGQQRIIKN